MFESLFPLSIKILPSKDKSHIQRWCLSPVTIVEFSRLFKIQRPLSPSSRDTSWAEGQAGMTKIPWGVKIFLSVTNVLPSAAQISQTPLFFGWKLLDWNLLHLPSFPASQKKIWTKRTKRTWVDYFSLWSFHCLFVDPLSKQAIVIHRSDSLTSQSASLWWRLKGGGRGGGCGDIAMQCTG